MAGQIEQFEDNHHYFAVDGTPVFLLGATHENGWYPISEVDHAYQRDLRRLQRVISNIDSPHVRGFVRVLPYSVISGTRALQPWDFDPVTETFDLETFDPRWEERLESFLDITSKLDIIVSLEVWDDWSVTRGPGGASDPGPDAAWNAHPFNPANNRNYDTLSTETATCDAPFYSTVPPSDGKTAVLDCQQTYVDHLLELTQGYDNILYSLSNESRASLAWSNYWAEYVGKSLDTDRFVGDMPSTSGEKGTGQCDPKFAPPALIDDDRYDYVDISQAVSRHSFGDDPPMEGVMAGQRIADYYELQAEHGVTKPLVVSKDYTNERPYAISVIWSKFVGGAASARFHRPLNETFLGEWDQQDEATVADECFEMIESLGKFITDTRFWRLKPAPALVSAGDASGGVLTLCEPGVEYVVQLIDWGGEPVRIPLDPGSYLIRWYDPDTGAYIAKGMTIEQESDSERDLEPPLDVSDLILHLKAL